jgi:hypothetical protein
MELCGNGDALPRGSGPTISAVRRELGLATNANVIRSLSDHHQHYFHASSILALIHASTWHRPASPSAVDIGASSSALFLVRDIFTPAVGIGRPGRHGVKLYRDNPINLLLVERSQTDTPQTPTHSHFQSNRYRGESQTTIAIIIAQRIRFRLCSH